jgi:hypothetical protein
LDQFGGALAVGDFNRDGYADLAVASPGESFGDNAEQAGMVHVLYGSKAGLRVEGNQNILQGPIFGIGDTIESFEAFGHALACGNFNGDRYADMAIGVPAENLGTLSNAGMVHVLYGSPSGLVLTSDSQQWTQDTLGVPDSAESHDEFGLRLAAGDFNGDGRDELVIGVPHEHLGDIEDAGGVLVLRGTRQGLTAANSRFWTQDSAGIAGQAEDADEFGLSLASGDFNGDNRDDLAVGALGEPVNGDGGAGAVHVLYGSANGLMAARNQLWHQDSPGIADGAESGERFGSALAAGDFNGNGRDDLAVGVPSEGLFSFDPLTLQQLAGAVHVLYGKAVGLSAVKSQFWGQGPSAGSRLGAGDVLEGGDSFGMALAAGQFNRKGKADLVVGVPHENLHGLDNGLVHVLYGTARRLTPSKVQTWSQADLGTFGDDFDQFGARFGALP